MAERNLSGGQGRSRSALGDVTNRIGKRGFSGREKDGVKSFDYKRDAVKRVCVSTHPISGINSFKGTVTTKMPSENRDTNSYDDNDGFLGLKGSLDVIGNSIFHAGYDKGKSLDFGRENVVYQSVNNLDVVDLNDSGDRCGQTKFLNKVDPVMENLEGGKVLNFIGNGAGECSQLDSIKENKIPRAAEVTNENKCPSLDFGMFGTAKELGNNSRADASLTASETGNDFLQDCDAGEEIISREDTQSDINDHHNDLDDYNTGNFVLSQSGSMNCALLPQSQESRVFGIDKSTETKEDECAQMDVGTNAIKTCSCSFCIKAAYIWLDLHQKDIKARLSVLKKSQKDASILAERSSRIEVNEAHFVESINRTSKMESHLMHQWRSLFHHMSNICEAECAQLEASLLPLNNLRDKCKAEMELNQSEKL